MAKSMDLNEPGMHHLEIHKTLASRIIGRYTYIHVIFIAILLLISIQSETTKDLNMNIE
jgi:hypothetical protein